jgi:hypothetical protein
MTITLDLPPETETLLKQEAARQGLDASAFVQRLVEAGLHPSRTAKQQAALDYFAKLRAEYDSATPQEREAAQQELETFKANMNANRKVEGRPPVYP